LAGTASWRIRSPKAATKTPGVQDIAPKADFVQVTVSGKRCRRFDRLPNISPKMRVLSVLL